MQADLEKPHTWSTRGERTRLEWPAVSECDLSSPWVRDAWSRKALLTRPRVEWVRRSGSEDGRVAMCGMLSGRSGWLPPLDIRVLGVTPTHRSWTQDPTNGRTSATGQLPDHGLPQHIENVLHKHSVTVKDAPSAVVAQVPQKVWYGPKLPGAGAAYRSRPGLWW